MTIRKVSSYHFKGLTCERQEDGTFVVTVRFLDFGMSCDEGGHEFNIQYRIEPRYVEVEFNEIMTRYANGKTAQVYTTDVELKLFGQCRKLDDLIDRRMWWTP